MNFCHLAVLLIFAVLSPTSLASGQQTEREKFIHPAAQASDYLQISTATPGRVYVLGNNTGLTVLEDQGNGFDTIVHQDFDFQHQWDIVDPGGSAYARRVGWIAGSLFRFEIVREIGGVWQVSETLDVQGGFCDDAPLIAALSGEMLVVVREPGGNCGNQFREVDVYEYSSSTWNFVNTLDLQGHLLEAAPNVEIFESSVVVRRPAYWSGLWTDEVLFFAKYGASYSLSQVVVSPDTDYRAEFGHGIKVSQMGLFITAPLSDEFSTDGGAVYWYEEDSGGDWALSQILGFPGIPQNAQIGRSLDAKGDWVVIGNPNARRMFSDSGIGYLLRWNGADWEEQLIAPSDPSHLLLFGSTCILGLNDVYIGAPKDDDGGSNSGAIYLLDKAIASDSDADGLSDQDEITIGSDPFDQDSDDDGLGDGQEVTEVGTDPTAFDTEADGLSDGVELGISSIVWDGDLDGDGIPDVGGTDPAVFLPDQDPLSKTNPLDLDSDDDGIADGVEDLDANGAVTAYETDAAAFDSDLDGLGDGMEIGIVSGTPDTDMQIFRPDEDPMTTTDPKLKDTDGGGVLDGIEDQNKDGGVNTWETDPNLSSDEAFGLYVSNLLPGQAVHFEVYNATPNETVIPAYSINGPGPTATGLGLFLDHTQPKLLMDPFLSDPEGRASVDRSNVPVSAPLGLSVWFQAVEIPLSSVLPPRKSNSLLVPIGAN